MVMTSNSQLVMLLDQWRQSMGMGHREFSTFLGRQESEWSHLRAGRRQPSEGFVRHARERANARGGTWPAAIDAAYQHDALARVALPT